MTLLELLVVISVLGLLTGLAAAAHGGSGQRQQQRWLAQATALLQDARDEAIGSGRSVRVQWQADALRAEPTRHGLALRTAGAQLRWQPAGAGGTAGPVFHPDGSAEPGMLECLLAGGMRRLAIDWQGRVSDGDATR